LSPPPTPSPSPEPTARHSRHGGVELGTLACIFSLEPGQRNPAPPELVALGGDELGLQEWHNSLRILCSSSSVWSRESRSCNSSTRRTNSPCSNAAHWLDLRERAQEVAREETRLGP
jgi:hypothetical protein